ncbi:MAG: hypothetical protein JO079_13575 [Frankiaceae bacterium]|nr:hypothetical protein [Frankiaceae bacterium]
MTYDASGRLTDDACNTTGYDGFDRLTSVTPDTVALDTSCAKNTVTYGYDGADRQATRTASTLGTNAVTTQSFYDGLSQRVVGETYSGGTGPTSLDYALSPQGTPQAATTTGTGAALQYLADDGKGNTVTITTSAGGASGMACALRYDPFGNPVQNNNNTAPATGPCYTGSTAVDALYRQGRRDSATGNYQLGSRTYDPSKNTFYTPDTYRNAPSAANLVVGTDPLTRNAYNYVNGDPVNQIDPDGHMPCGDDIAGHAYCAGDTKLFDRRLQAHDLQLIINATSQRSDTSYHLRYELPRRLGSANDLAQDVWQECSVIFPISGCLDRFLGGQDLHLQQTLLHGLYHQGFPVQVIYRDSSSFAFVALAGHPEGPGRIIRFSFTTDAGGHAQLHIDTSSPGSFATQAPLVRDVDFFFAKRVWDQLASNLEFSVAFHRYPGGPDTIDPTERLRLVLGMPPAYNSQAPVA